MYVMYVSKVLGRQGTIAIEMIKVIWFFFYAQKLIHAKQFKGKNLLKQATKFSDFLSKTKIVYSLTQLNIFSFV